MAGRLDSLELGRTVGGHNQFLLRTELGFLNVNPLHVVNEFSMV